MQWSDFGGARGAKRERPCQSSTATLEAAKSPRQTSASPKEKDAWRIGAFLSHMMTFVFFNLQNQQFDPLPHFCSGLVIDSPNFDRGIKNKACPFLFGSWFPAADLVYICWPKIKIRKFLKITIWFWFDSGISGQIFPTFSPCFLSDSDSSGRLPTLSWSSDSWRFHQNIGSNEKLTKTTRNIPPMVFVSCCFSCFDLMSLMSSQILFFHVCWILLFLRI